MKNKLKTFFALLFLSVNAFSAEKVFLHSSSFTDGDIGERLNVGLLFKKTLRDIYGDRFQTIADLRDVEGVKEPENFFDVFDFVSENALTDYIPGTYVPFSHVKASLSSEDSALLVMVVTAHGVLEAEGWKLSGSKTFESEIFQTIERYASIMNRIVFFLNSCYGANFLREKNRLALEEISKKSGAEITVVSTGNDKMALNSATIHSIYKSALLKAKPPSLSFSELFKNMRALQLEAYRTSYVPSDFQLPAYVDPSSLSAIDIQVFNTRNVKEFETTGSETYPKELDQFASLFSKSKRPELSPGAPGAQTVESIMESQEQHRLKIREHATPLSGERDFLQHAYIHFPFARIEKTSPHFALDLVDEKMLLDHLTHLKQIALIDPVYTLGSQLHRFLSSLRVFFASPKNNHFRAMREFGDMTQSENMAYRALGHSLLWHSKQNSPQSVRPILMSKNYFASAVIFGHVASAYHRLPDDQAWLEALKTLLDEGYEIEPEQAVDKLSELDNHASLKAKALNFIFRHSKTPLETKTKILKLMMRMIGVAEAKIKEQLELGIKIAFKHHLNIPQSNDRSKGLMSQPFAIEHMFKQGLSWGYSYCNESDSLIPPNQDMD